MRPAWPWTGRVGSAAGSRGRSASCTPKRRIRTGTRAPFSHSPTRPSTSGGRRDRGAAAGDSQAARPAEVDRPHHVVERLSGGRRRLVAEPRLDQAGGKEGVVV